MARPGFDAPPQPLGLPGMGELRPLSRDQALALGPGWSHACHALLFAPDPGRLYGRTPLRSAVLVMGMVHVPLYVQRHSPGGLSAFLQDSFVGMAKFQLLYALKVLNMVPVEKLAQAVAAAQAPQKIALGAAGSSASTPALSPSEPA